jgi:hypothetical protein
MIKDTCSFGHKISWPYLDKSKPKTSSVIHYEFECQYIEADKQNYQNCEIDCVSS